MFGIGYLTTVLVPDGDLGKSRSCLAERAGDGFGIGIELSAAVFAVVDHRLGSFL